MSDIHSEKAKSSNISFFISTAQTKQQRNDFWRGKTKGEEKKRLVRSAKSAPIKSSSTPIVSRHHYKTIIMIHQMKNGRKPAS